MEIKDELVLNGMAWEAADNIEYNTIGEFQNSNINMPGYYIVRRKGNLNTLQGKYTCHAFNSPVIIPECEIVCAYKFMKPMRKIPYWHHKLDESIPVMAKLKQVVMPYSELIQDNNTTNKFQSHFKGYSDMNPHLLSGHNHQIILDKIEVIENINHD